MAGGTITTSARMADVDPSLAELRVSPYERVASGMLASLSLVGTLVVGLALVYLSRRVVEPPVLAVPVQVAEIGYGDDDVLGDGSDVDFGEPAEGEIDGEATTPESSADMVDVGEALAAVSEVVEGMGPALADDSLDSVAEPWSDGPRKRRGVPGGVKGGRGAGPGFGLGRAQRWEVTYLEGNTLDLYAAQLDYFKIELGALGGGDEVTYAFNFTKPRPDTRTGLIVDEKRLYMAWRQGSLRDADEQLARRAGIDSGDRIIVQFYPPEISAKLAQLEKDYAKRNPSQIAKTRFAVRPLEAGYEFYVLVQIAR